MQSCLEGDIQTNDSPLLFSAYDIAHSVTAPPDDREGRIHLAPDDVWFNGSIIYSERDGRFLINNGRDRWNTTWTYAFAYGTFSPEGIRPNPWLRYVCRETGQEYRVERGRLVAVDGAPATVRVVSWNIGCFNNGNRPDTRIDDAENYAALCEDFRGQFDSWGANLVGLCEFLPSIFEGRETREDILGGYVNGYVSPEVEDYRGKALMANTPLTNVRQIDLGIGTALEGDMLIGGRTVRVCICHPTWWNNSTDGDANWRELKELANRYRYIERVILMGDFNVRRDREEKTWALFTDAGFMRANGGNGKQPGLTSYNNTLNVNSVDNILVKGGEILSLKIVQHTPEGCDPMEPQIADERRWDAVNLSDHFPLICEIAFP